MEAATSRFTVRAAMSSLVLGIVALIAVGCKPSGPPASSTASNTTSNPNAQASVPAGTSPAVATSVKDAQAAGNAYRDQAMKNGAAGGAASNGWR